MQEEDLQKCSEYAFEDFCTEGTPRDLDPDTVGQLFMANYDDPWIRYEPEPSRVGL
jgi:alcohol dehydrogenase class IV